MAETALVEIRLNGAARSVRAGVTLAALLEELALDPRWVVAEHNGEPVARERFPAVALAEGDRLELVRPVAGG
ncbi:MAG: sulfur carrier protein ThiS [Gemmatimonadetes bacterium]|nr:sulfur carrier protein ThiS [Gemmatimonadota bacterium]